MGDKTIYRLLVKTHRKTGKKYLCVTKRKNYIRYLGSGTGWKQHLAQHGRDIVTEVLYETTDINSLAEQGIFYSELWNVVESDEWMNRKTECGYTWDIDGKKIGRLKKSGAILVAKVDDKRWETGELVYVTSGMSGARNTITGKIEWVESTDERWKNGGLVGVRTGMTNAKNTLTDEVEYVRCDDPRWENGELVGMCCALNTLTGKKEWVATDDHRWRDDTLVGVTKGKSAEVKMVTALNLLTGLNERVTPDDERWGRELVGVTKGTVTVRDSVSGQTMKVSVTDERRTTGQMVEINTGTITVKNAAGETMKVSVDDERRLSGELVSIAKGMVAARNTTTGKTEWVSVDDERWNTPELVHPNSGRIVVYDKNGKKHRVYKDDGRVIAGDLLPLKEHRAKNKNR